ncbi:PREDICTED: uncharacterized protein LOC104778642 [Camelina sativa]|uniref:Uncharacterized protein LOC104778642 n=1 Tax=Camelina sativa TaxID=90675 RepID=A0ABM0YIH7_CAMSA|nr:PREDICTED: uncharacterized protein LOC104778642 [Camelina sativa]
MDKKNNKIVFVEAGKDFVDILFGLMSLPMGAIVRLRGKTEKKLTLVGCMTNLYQSVLALGKASFSTNESRELLLYSRYLRGRQCRTLGIDDSEEVKLFVCPDSQTVHLCAISYSCFPSVQCTYGKLMFHLIPIRPSKDGSEIFKL